MPAAESTKKFLMVRTNEKDVLEYE